MINSAAALELLSSIFSAIFLLVLPFRLRQLHRAEIKVSPTWLVPAKVVLAFGIAALSAARIAESARHAPGLRDEIWQWSGVLDASLSCTAGLGLGWLSIVEHRRSVRPSVIAQSYLLANSVCQIVWLAAPGIGQTEMQLGLVIWRNGKNTSFILAAAQLGLELLLLVLESRGKDGKRLFPKYQCLSPEDNSGIIGNAAFWWINPILAQGSRKILADADLPALSTQASSRTLWEKIEQSWLRKAAESSDKLMTLPLALLRCLSSALKAAIPSRLLLIILQYAQPTLIKQAIRFVTTEHISSDQTSQGFWLVLSACVIYVGLAITTGVYKHQMNKIRIMSRGALVGLIYNRVFEVQVQKSDDGAATTLMSSDVDNLSGVAEDFVDLCGYAIGLLVGLVMLYQEVGWLCFLPIVLIICGSRVSKFVAQNLRTRQKQWSGKTQERIAAITSMLSSMKAIKAMGTSSAVASHVTKLREEEINNAKRVRWVNVIYNASANALGIFTPIVTVVLYAVTSKGKFDAETAFPTVAVIAVVIHPANMILTVVPRLVGSFASFERMQAYLVKSTRVDQRIIEPESNEICLKDVTVQPDNSPEPILADVNLRITCPSIVVVSGSVGSGKSTLARIILGEIAPAQGSITLPSRRIGLCAQSAWLPDGTVRDVICGFDHDIDHQWYSKVVSACCLDYDYALLDSGDETLVGSQGMNLSGGQRQRVALARLLYSRSRLVVLDDSFSALDGKTGSKVIGNLLGPDGVLKQLAATIIWISNNASYFHLADLVICLSNGRLEEPSIDRHMPQRLLSDSKSKPQIENELAGPAGATLTKVQTQKKVREDAASDLSRKTGDLSLYALYFRQAGILNSLLMIFCTASYCFCITFPQFWLRWWTEDEDRSHMAVYITGYVLLGFGAWLTTCCSMWCAFTLMTSTSGRRLHKMLLDIVIAAPMAFFYQTDVGTTLNRFSQDINLIDTSLPAASLSLSVQITKLAVQVGLLIAVQKFLAVTLPVCMVIVYLIQRVYLRTSRQLRFLDLESRSAVFTSFLETVQGVTTIRAFEWQEQATSRTIEQLDRSQRAASLLYALQRWLNLVLDLMVAAIAIGLITLAVCLKGTTSGGAIGVALNIVLVANSTLLRLVESWTSLETSLSAISRLKTLQKNTPSENEPIEHSEPPEYWPSAGRIMLRDVSACYKVGANALSSVSLTIEPGQKVLICGRTGSGKSTTILVLLRMIETSGTFTVDGLDVTKIPRSLIRQRCFITIPQEAYFTEDASLRFNMSLGGSSNHDALIIEALEKAHLWKKLTSGTGAEEPLDCLLSSFPAMSAGQLQLLALARALARRELLQVEFGIKAVLLLDEATSSLDPAMEEIMQDVIDKEYTRRGHTVIIVTHRPQAIASRLQNDRDIVVWMEDGKVRNIEDPESLIQGSTSTSGHSSD